MPLMLVWGLGDN